MFEIHIHELLYIQDKFQLNLIQFKNHTNEGDVESKLYLEDSNNNLELALENWKNDNNFVQTQQPVPVQEPELKEEPSVAMEVATTGNTTGTTSNTDLGKDTSDKLESEVEMKNINENAEK